MALQAHDTLTGHSTSTENPSVQALSILFLASAIPFIVFGFLDNSIMLVAGEEIDARLGVNLGITMLASAGLGNTLADVIGVGVSTSIEVGVGCCRSFRNDVKAGLWTYSPQPTATHSHACLYRGQSGGVRFC